MTTKTLTIDIPQHLYERFYHLVCTKFRSSKETYAKAMQSALEIALTNFLDSLEAEDKEDREA